MPDPVLTARGRLAYASRRDVGSNPEKITAARRDFTAAKLERHVREVIDAFPPISDEQKLKIATLLMTGGTR